MCLLKLLYCNARIKDFLLSSLTLTHSRLRPLDHFFVSVSVIVRRGEFVQHQICSAQVQNMASTLVGLSRSWHWTWSRINFSIYTKNLFLRLFFFFSSVIIMLWISCSARMKLHAAVFINACCLLIVFVLDVRRPWVPWKAPPNKMYYYYYYYHYYR